LVIRKYSPEDRGQLIALWQQVFPDDPPHNEPAAVIDAKLAVDDLIFIAEIERGIIGACMVGYDGHRGWLYAVGVKPEHRRGSIGRQLVNAALLSLKSLGCKKVNLQIRASNTEVAAFYQSLGFAVEDRMSMGKLIR
jgi:ribosomal protein S18 acetylase RimI-like enzyme